MAGRSRSTLNVANLEALGARRLAELLIELCRDAPAKRRLRLELSGDDGVEAVAAAIAKRLASLGRARTYVDWTKRQALIDDLDLQRRMIVDKVAPERPALALDLLWRFLALAAPTLERVDDGTGRIGDVFARAVRDVGAVAPAAKPDPIALAERVYDAVVDNGYGQYDGVLEAVHPALGAKGVGHLRERLGAALAQRPAEGYDPQAAALRSALAALADAEGNVDAFVAQMPPPGRRSPPIATAIAERLLAAKRPTEALAVLDEAPPGDQTDEDTYPFEPAGSSYRLRWEQTRLQALELLGRGREAQALRLAWFERRLVPEHLRAYLKPLPDFEDVRAETAALDHALAFPDAMAALAFLADWPDHHRAARLVRERLSDLDGNAFYVLDPAARAIEGKQPLAAVLLRRLLIEDTLRGAKSKRYRHAARHVRECAACDALMEDYAGFETHNAFIARLRDTHRRKSGFWERLEG